MTDVSFAGDCVPVTPTFFEQGADLDVEGDGHASTLAKLCYSSKQHFARPLDDTRAMTQNANTILAANLRRLMAEKGLSQPALAKASGIGQTTISLYLHPERRQPGAKGKIPSAKIGEVESLADALGIEAWQLLVPPAAANQKVGDVTPEVVQAVVAAGPGQLVSPTAPPLGDVGADAANDEYAYINRIDAKLSAGRGTIIYDAEQRGRLSFRRDWLRSQGVNNPDKAVLAEVDGDSMAGHIPHGATILVDLSQTETVNGKVYAIFHDKEFYVKRLWSKAGITTAHSDNEDKEAYPPFPLVKDGDQVIGRVFWCGFGL